MPIYEKEWREPLLKKGDRVRVIREIVIPGDTGSPFVGGSKGLEGTVKRIIPSKDKIKYWIRLDKFPKTENWFEEHELEKVTKENPVYEKEWPEPPELKKGNRVRLLVSPAWFIRIHGSDTGTIRKIVVMDEETWHEVEFKDGHIEGFRREELELLPEENPIYEKEWGEPDIPYDLDVLKNGVENEILKFKPSDLELTDYPGEYELMVDTIAGDQLGIHQASAAANFFGIRRDIGGTEDEMWYDIEKYADTVANHMNKLLAMPGHFSFGWLQDLQDYGLVYHWKKGDHPAFDKRASL